MWKTAFIGALLFATSATAQVAGRWSGTYTFTFTVTGCQTPFTMSGNVTATFLQSGALVSGRMDLTNALIFNGNCSPAKGDLTSAFVGNVAGTSVTWEFPNDANGTQFAGTMNGNQMTGTITDSSGDSGSLTLTRTPPDSAATNLTGSWTGTYNFTDKCPNGTSKNYTGNLTLGLTQTAGLATGVVTMQNVPLYTQNCTTVALLNVSLSTSGIVSGSTFNGSVFDPFGSFDFDVTANLSGGTLAGSVTGASVTSTTGTFTLTPAATSAPRSDFAGSFAGTYNESDDVRAICLNIGFLQLNGTATVAINQAGNAVSGFLVFANSLSVTSDGFGGCSVITVGDQVLPLYGTLDNTNTFNVLQPVPGGAVVSITATLAANGVTGTISDSAGDTATFTATRTTGPPPATVTTFGASPPVIAPGQKTTLFWSTANATSVSIDNGIGSEPLSGSMTVAPGATTTYTLTANGPGGSATSRITIVVATPQTRHRAVRP